MNLTDDSFLVILLQNNLCSKKFENYTVITGNKYDYKKKR